MDELTAKLILLRAPALSGALYLRLLQTAGSAQAAVQTGPDLWHTIALPQRCIHFLQAPASVDAERRWLEQAGHHLLMLGDSNYPELLAQLPDAPLGLYVSGHIELLKQPQLAIVGSRNPTPYGREAAEAFAKHLSQSGLTITSGLAAGIDAASHQGALQGMGSTLAVCGTGLDVIYPTSSKALATEISANGALVSEFPPGTPPRRHHFPQRNRIISGLSLGTLVVEAALHSGSLITARLAGEQGREVFALPGSIHSPLSKGCHQLIRQGAKLVDSVADILTELGPLAASLAQLSHAESSSEQTNLFDLPGFSEAPLDKDYEILLDALGFEAAGIDQLVARSGLGADAVASMLLILELNGQVATSPGGRYVRLSQPQ